MSSYKNSSEKNLYKNSSTVNHNDKLNLENSQQFNSFKFQHFNNFFNNFFHDKLKSQLNNYLSEEKDNAPSIFKNEILNETLSEKASSDFNNTQKKFLYKNNNGIINAKLINNNGFQKYNYNNPPLKYSSLDRIYINKFNNSKSNNKSTSINSKYFSKEQYTSPNISKNKTSCSSNKIKLKLEISSINNNFNIDKKNKLNNTSESFFMKNHKVQQLPKDAANCLLLFLKKNKKNLIRTSKYISIYKKYKNIIDNIIDKIPEEDSLHRKNNNENILGYYKRKAIDGNDILNTANLIWNNYDSKSEKQRHIQILNELTILKGNIEKNKNLKNLYMKDFLNKYNINYNNKQLSFFEKFLNNFDNKKYGNFLSPKLSMKNMISDIFEKGEKFKFENEEKKIVIPALNVKSTIHNNEKNNKGIESYSLYNRDNKTNKNNKEKSLNLSSTNSFLKEMERQKLVFKPNKTYVSNYNSIIEDIGKEIGEIESEIITEKQYKNLLPNLLNKKKRNINIKDLAKSNTNLFITSNKNIKSNINIKKDKSVDFVKRNLQRKTTKIIIDKLNKESNFDKVEYKDIKRKFKLTEYIVYNKFKNKLKLENLEKQELYEYLKKENNNNMN